MNNLICNIESRNKTPGPMLQTTTIQTIKSYGKNRLLIADEDIIRILYSFVMQY